MISIRRWRAYSINGWRWIDTVISIRRWRAYSINGSRWIDGRIPRRL
ncbi:MAG TPA: hypothetical protein VNT50_02870 [Microbacterium sp.]|nr:hypothetical protein [Microbacterium sp.]